MHNDYATFTRHVKILLYGVFLGLLVPGMLWAAPPLAPWPIPDEPDITIEAGGTEIAAGTISQDVTFKKPHGAIYNHQILRIELVSAARQEVRWDKKAFQAKHGLELPTHTTGKNVFDLWMFKYNGPLRVWSFIGTTQPVFVPTPGQ